MQHRCKGGGPDDPRDWRLRAAVWKLPVRRPKSADGALPRADGKPRNAIRDNRAYRSWIFATTIPRDFDLPERVREIAWKAQARLCARYRQLMAKGKKATVVTVAIAREIAAFLWDIARQVAPIPVAAS